MKESTVIPYSLFQLYRARKEQNALLIPHKLQVHGYVLTQAEVGDFLFSGNLYAFPEIGQEEYQEIEFVIPEACQQQLYKEIVPMKRRKLFHTVFSSVHDAHGRLQRIFGFGRSETEDDLYVVKAEVGRGRRITSVSYGAFEKSPVAKEDMVPNNILRFPRRKGQVPQESPPAV